ncbi:uncharacterized protein LOC142517709 [Primulina tabacum]|uniref:uncharacterized protein LOC142517709 n=1 Tax=Primulina tabacum TaxID=48773 RepID=UPI003F5A98DD
MSNLKQLTDSSLSKTNQGMKPCSGVVTRSGSGFQGNTLDTGDQNFPIDATGCLDRLLQSIGDSTCFAPDANGKQLSDVIADYQMLIDPSTLGSFMSGMENGGQIQESLFGPDLVAFDLTMSSEDSGIRTSLTHEVQNCGKDTINSLDFNAPSQFSTTLFSPSEREDQEFLASLLASDQFGEEQTTLDGM